MFYFDYRWLIFLFSSLLLFSCNLEEKAVEGVSPFFSVKDFIEKEIKERPYYNGVNKTITVNGKKEERKIDALELAKDLKMFSVSDINKPSWYDKYVIKKEIVKSDTALNQNLVLMSYTTNNDKLRTKKIEVLAAIGIDTIVQSIFIENETDNFLNHSTQHLLFEPGKGYEMKIKQKILFSTEKTIEIKSNL